MAEIVDFFLKLENASLVKEWLSAFAVLFGVLPALVGATFVIFNYRLKLRAETRLAKAAQVDQEIKLLKTFSELMDLANGRRGHHASEKAVEILLNDFFKDEPADLLPHEAKDQSTDSSKKPTTKREILQEHLSNAILTIHVGRATQNAAMEAIANLGSSHKSLRPIAIQALESLRDDKINPLLAEQRLTHLRAIKA